MGRGYLYAAVMLVLVLLGVELLAPITSVAASPASSTSTNTTSSGSVPVLVLVLNNTISVVERVLRERGVPANSTAWALVAKARMLLANVTRLLEEGRTGRAWALAQRVMVLVTEAAELAEGRTPPPLLARVKARALALYRAALVLEHKIRLLARRGVIGNETALKLLGEVEEAKKALRSIVAGLEKGNLTLSEAVRELKSVESRLKGVESTVREAMLRLWGRILAARLKREAKGVEKALKALEKAIEKAREVNATATLEFLEGVYKALEDYYKAVTSLADRIESGNITIRDLELLHRLRVVSLLIAKWLHHPTPATPLPVYRKPPRTLAKRIIVVLAHRLEAMARIAERMAERLTGEAKSIVEEALGIVKDFLETLRSMAEGEINVTRGVKELKTCLEEYRARVSSVASLPRPLAMILHGIEHVMEVIIAHVEGLLKPSKPLVPVPIPPLPVVKHHAKAMAARELEAAHTLLERALAQVKNPREKRLLLVALKAISKAARSVKEGRVREALAHLTTALRALVSIDITRLPPRARLEVIAATRLVSMARMTLALQLRGVPVWATS